MIEQGLTQSALLLVLCVFLSSCKPEPLVPISMPEHQLISCEDYAYEITPIGLLTNNVWNKHAADGADIKPKQCILKRQQGNNTVYGWSWSWPRFPRTVFAQPQIKIGASPWDPSPSYGAQLPIAINNIKSANFAHKLNVIHNSDFNVASTMWLVDQALDVEQLSKDEAQEREAQKRAIRTEMMIWTYYTPGQLKPGGKHLDSITIDGLVWEYWYAPKWGDVSEVNQNTWRHIAFRLAEPSLDAKINIGALLNYAVDQKHIEPEWFVADLELGTEVMGGDGFAIVEQFDFTLKEK